MTMAAKAPIEVRDPDKVMSPTSAADLAGRQVRIHSVAMCVAEIRPYMAACKPRTTGLGGDEWAAALQPGSVDLVAFLVAEEQARPGAKRAPRTRAEAEPVVEQLTDRQCIALSATLQFRADQLKRIGPPSKRAQLPVAPTLLVPTEWPVRLLDHLAGHLLLALPLFQGATAPWIAAP